jgi:multidrug efflux system outer membrane protein
MSARPASRATARPAIAALAAAALAAGCSMLNPPPAPAKPEGRAPAMPPAWQAASATGPSLADAEWRRFFAYGELPALIDEALRANRDLRIAAERIELARAQLGLARSALVPTIAADASATSQRGPTPLDPNRNRSAESYSIGLAMPTWEIDLWGRIRSQVDAARRNLEATDAQRYAAQVSLVASVAGGWLQLLEVDQQLAVSRRTRDSRRDSLRLIRLRFDAGVVSMVDVTQAETSLAQADQAIAELERQRAAAENALSLLLGRNPGPVARSSRLLEMPVPATLPAGLPSDLLRRRPDLVAAERAMAATEADVDAARKAFLPTVSLTGFLGVVSPQLSQLLGVDRGAWSVTPGVTLPLFTGGRLEANLDAAAARQRIALEDYGRTVQVALRDVEDALTAFQRRREQREALERIVASSRERLRLVDLRYLNGISSYFEVLDSQRVLFDAELQLAQATAATYGAVIQLYRALGGGWDAPAATVPDATAASR